MAVVKFSIPFKDRFGTDRYQIPLDEPVTLQQLLEQLAKGYPEVKDKLFQGQLDATYRFSFICIREGRIMALEDLVSNQDVVEIIPPIMGG